MAAEKSTRRWKAAPAASSRDKSALERFSALLRRYREQAGYATTRGFYEALGGRDFFDCTYKAYLNAENGASLPSPRLVEKMVAAFRLALHKEQAREFAPAYLRMLIGEGDFFELAVKSLADPDQPAAAAAGRALRLDERQLRGLQDAEGYWCFSVLAHDKGHWSPQELAAFLDLPPGAAAKALSRLSSAGLLAQDKDKKFFCPHAGKVFLPPMDDASFLTRHADGLEKNHGERLMEQPLLLRASESEFSRYFPFFTQSLNKAAQYAVTSKGPDTSLFLVEAGVFKIISF